VGELVRIFPVLRELPNVSEPGEITDPGSAQFRLFDAYVAFMRAASEPNGPRLDERAAPGWFTVMAGSGEHLNLNQ
jgi:hypothetical protein